MLHSAQSQPRPLSERVAAPRGNEKKVSPAPVGTGIARIPASLRRHHRAKCQAAFFSCCVSLATPAAARQTCRPSIHPPLACSLFFFFWPDSLFPMTRVSSGKFQLGATDAEAQRGSRSTESHSGVTSTLLIKKYLEAPNCSHRRRSILNDGKRIGVDSYY